MNYSKGKDGDFDVNLNTLLFVYAAYRGKIKGIDPHELHGHGANNLVIYFPAQSENNKKAHASDLKEVTILKNIVYQVTKEDIDNKYKELKIKYDDLYYDLTAFERKDYRLIAFDNGFNSSIFDYVDFATIAFDGAKNIYDKLENGAPSNNRMKHPKMLRR